MQILYYTAETPKAYVGGAVPCPGAPTRCPHKDCHMPVKLKKHGYYRRYLILRGFEGYIRIRRYRCPVCGRTVSMLPSLCVPGFQYGADVIIGAARAAYQCGSVRRAVLEWNQQLPQITRRHMQYYLSRLRKNRVVMQFALNEMSSAFIRLGTIAEDKAWAQSFLEEARLTNPPQFNADFHRITGKSFMSTYNMIA